jgi:hypothetical protein
MKKLLLAAACGFAMLYALSPWLPLYVTVGALKIPIAQAVQPVVNVVEPITMPITLGIIALASIVFFLPIQRAQRAPGTFEFVELGDDVEHFGLDYQGRRVEGVSHKSSRIQP